MHEQKSGLLVRLAVVPTALLLGVLVVFAALQRKLIYFPTVAGEQEQIEEATGLGLAAWRDGSGALIGWRPQAESSGKARVLVFHGNAGYALHRGYFIRGFQNRDHGWGVYLFEYPGYGARKGTPSEVAIKAASSQALEALLQRGSEPVFLVGESLGSGVACYLAANYPEQVSGLLLITPFTTLADVAAHHYPWLPVDTLLREGYDSVTALSRYGGPVAFLLAGRDEVVPVGLGRELHAGYGGAKWLRVEPEAGHNTLPLFPGADWWSEVMDFIAPLAASHRTRS